MLDFPPDGAEMDPRVPEMDPRVPEMNPEALGTVKLSQA